MPPKKAAAKKGRHNGRKVVLIPTAREKGLKQCVKSFVQNALDHDYGGEVHFVVADYNPSGTVEKHSRDFDSLRKKITEAGKDNIHIHHFGPEEQATILRQLHDSDPGRWEDLQEYVGSYDSTPDGYGPARNRATLLAYSKGID